VHACTHARHALHAVQVSFSPDGRWVLSASFDKSIKLWDGLKGTFVATFRGHVGPVFQVGWSSDSRLFVSGSKDSTLKVRGGRPGRARAARGAVCVRRRVGVRCAGRRECSAAEGRTRSSDCCAAMHAWLPLPRRTRHTHAVHTSQVWDLRTRKLMVDLPGHADEVYAVDWSPDGSSVASGGKDKIVKLWRH
jgi:ribosome assembly protein 4